MRPVKGFVPLPVGALLRTSVTCERRYSAPMPMATTPLVDCQAMAGSTESVFRFASRDTKRPTHGSSQFVRRPYAANVPMPNVRLLPIGTMAYALGGTNVCRRY